jgi:hypothetical protein
MTFTKAQQTSEMEENHLLEDNQAYIRFDIGPGSETEPSTHFFVNREAAKTSAVFEPLITSAAENEVMVIPM